MTSLLKKVVGLVCNADDKEENKSTPLSDEDQKAVADVKSRLEFFFSDANIRQDRFLRNLLMEGDHMVPVETLLRFNTIKQHTENAVVVVAAVKELSALLKLDESETAIGRIVEFTEAMMDENIPKSLYIKNLPIKENDGGRKVYGVTVDEIKEPFKKYGEVILVKMIWGGFRKPKQPVGCAMVEFSEKDAQEKATAATLTIKDGSEVDPTEKIEIGGSKIEVMLLSEHIDNRKKEKDQKGGKKRRDREDHKDDKEIREFTCEWQPGCVIKLKGLPETCDRESLLDMIALQLDISAIEVKNKKIYADYSKGQTEGAIRFREPEDSIKEMADRLKSGELKIRGETVGDAHVLEGDLEKKYYDDFIAFKNKQIRHHAETKRSRKKGRYGGRRN